MNERKSILLRLDPAVYDALARWASDELRSTNAQIEFVLRRVMQDVGRLPAGQGRDRRPGRPPKQMDGHLTEANQHDPGVSPADQQNMQKGTPLDME